MWRKGQKKDSQTTALRRRAAAIPLPNIVDMCGGSHTATFNIHATMRREGLNN
jgi:hypothetical protein